MCGTGKAGLAEECLQSIIYGIKIQEKKRDLLQRGGYPVIFWLPGSADASLCQTTGYFFDDLSDQPFRSDPGLYSFCRLPGRSYYCSPVIAYLFPDVVPGSAGDQPFEGCPVCPEGPDSDGSPGGLTHTITGRGLFLI